MKAWVLLVESMFEVHDKDGMPLSYWIEYKPELVKRDMKKSFEKSVITVDYVK